MKENIGILIVGIVCVLTGILNMKGNISSLHAYHTRNISEEDKLIFGKKVGLGIIICGGSLMVNGGLSAIALYVGNPIFETIGKGLMIVGLIAGLGLPFYARKKYNKRIFAFK